MGRNVPVHCEEAQDMESEQKLNNINDLNTWSGLFLYLILSNKCRTLFLHVLCGFGDDLKCF